jgi:hypothetical protein
MSLERAFGESGAKHQTRGVNPKYVKGISILCYSILIVSMMFHDSHIPLREALDPHNGS